MTGIFHLQRNKVMRRMVSGVMSIIFTVGMVMPPQGYAQMAAPAVLSLPSPGTMVAPTATFQPVILKGINIRPDDAMKFDFIIDAGETGLRGEAFKTQADKLIKYFFTALAIPEKQLWVNLSPYEKNRIMPAALELTTMGRDMLAQDYRLK